MKTSLTIQIVILLLQASCSRKQEAIDVTNNFFYSVSDSTYGKPSMYYPLYDSLYTNVVCDIIDVLDDNVIERNDTFFVDCINNYTNKNGEFKQDSVRLYIAPNKDNNMIIFKSKGLIEHDDILDDFGKRVGAFNKKKDDDRSMIDIYRNLTSMFINEYIDARETLLKKVKVVRWDWENSYSGYANGECIIKNNLDYSITGVKYSVCYYDYNGGYMADDEDRINETIKPGERINYSWWSSNVKYASRADFILVFDNNLIMEFIKHKEYKGNEYQLFVKEMNK